MLGFGKSVPIALAGWLWADILLGLFVIFLAANSVGAPPVEAAPPSEKGIDPAPKEFVVEVDHLALLFGTEETVQREQERIAANMRDELRRLGEQRQVALILAFGAHESPTGGDRLAELGTARIRLLIGFEDTAIRTFHDLVAGDPGTRISFEVYVFQ